ncbi:ABC transporter permease [Kibdelosporangium aridum]|uniref:ABC-2 type transport system permease protein n=1 Tax=Kibdelosporangium aridum TaxID=2030 RepID=A0A1Y5XHV8_KIBAR|nr:ABC transporter permease [Kibdelosporangium aridum]SMC95554.1 ABC-2 type transport system permease protein [Kibdelosporangium aridum]
MTLLAVERIKLFSTRSPWWCMALALGLMVGFAALISGSAENASSVAVPVTQFGFTFALAVILVLATLSVTTEYRFNTIKTTFQAVPSRTSALLAKTTVVAVVSGVLGLIAAFGSLGVAMLLQPDANLALNSEADWRQIAGTGLVTFFAAVVAVSVGILIRHTAGAVSVLLAYSLVAENLVQLIPRVGGDIHQWLPFNVANRFLTGNPDVAIAFEGPGQSTSTLTPWGALAYFAGFSVVMLIIAIVTAKKRDA